MPKDERTHVIHIEEDLASIVSSKKESKRKKTDSTKLPPQSPYISQISNNHQSVNGTIEEFWEKEKILRAESSRSWTTSLHVFRKISNLSQAWKSAASSGARKTTDRECGLEIKYYVAKSRIVLDIVLLAFIVYEVYMVEAAQATPSSVMDMLFIITFFRGMLLIFCISFAFVHFWFDLDQYVGPLLNSRYWKF